MILKISIDSSRQYSICSCGLSKNLPYCDNAHRDYNEKNGTEYKSIKIISDKKINLEVSSSCWGKLERKEK